MLAHYKQQYHVNNFQFLIVDDDAHVMESDNIIFPAPPKASLKNIHPFFEIIDDLVTIKNERFEFNCVNLDIDGKHLITDIIIIPQKENENLIIIENLTKHYNNYQLTAQSRNESVINSEIIELKNKYLLEKEAFKNNFIANFSHQLRNPITASLIFSDLLINSGLSEQQKNYLNIVKSANKDLKERIDDILDMSKIQSGKLILVEEVFNLKDLINEIASSHDYFALKKGLEFTIELDDNLPETVMGDRYRVKQIIDNLLSNAIQNTNNGGIGITLLLNHTRARRANINIVVRDTGIGIEKANIASIFERFTKIEPTGHSSETIGLGLAIVKHLSEKMDGSIKVESKPNEGSTFTCNLSLKIAQFNIAQHKKDYNKTIAENDLNDTKNKQHIVLVEDSELIQLTILKVLASSGKYYVSIITEGEALVPFLLENEVALVLLPNNIQSFSAENLSSSVRSLPKPHNKIPLLLLASEVYKEDIKRFKRAGIKSVVTKPFDKEKLLDAVSKVLRK
ncbi:hypothetical protein MHTCC0001_06450 [Flavobacteriaceae bacterium MHTCC 0001]